MNDKRISLVLVLILVLAAVMLRLLPHPANFAPVTAIAIFGGAVLPRKLALWVPLMAMVISDMIIGFYDIMLVVWLCYALTALAASFWLERLRVTRIAVLTLSASLFFFMVTNFAVWAAGGMYPHTLSGLAQCYTMALPFFRNTFLSDMFYAGVLFGMFALSNVAIQQLKWRHQKALLR